MKTKYYRFYSQDKGERFFKVTHYKDVVQIITKNQSKKGRPYATGITFIKYITFVATYGFKFWRDPNKLKAITKGEFEIQFTKMVNKLAK
jgi:hypothetical protein